MDKQAFPIPVAFGDADSVITGLTRRELFAAMIMQGNATNPTCDEMTGTDSAKFAVIWADALIAELDKC